MSLAKLTVFFAGGGNNRDGLRFGWSRTGGKSPQADLRIRPVKLGSLLDPLPEQLLFFRAEFVAAGRHFAAGNLVDQYTTRIVAGKDHDSGGRSLPELIKGGHAEIAAGVVDVTPAAFRDQ